MWWKVLYVAIGAFVALMALIGWLIVQCATHWENGD